MYMHLLNAVVTNDRTVAFIIAFCLSIGFVGGIIFMAWERKQQDKYQCVEDPEERLILDNKYEWKKKAVNE